MGKQKNIVVIGGGLLGAATAYQLTLLSKGVDVTIIERYSTASQASARAACLLTKLRTKPEVGAMVKETYDSIARIEQLLGENLDVQRCGSITIGTSDASIESLEKLAKIAQHENIEYEWISSSQVKGYLPWIDENLAKRSLFTPSDAYIDSAVWCNAMIAAAVRQGAKLKTNCHVKSIVVEDSIAKGVEIVGGEFIPADIVVNAAGAWSNLLLENLPYKLPHTPVRSHFWITQVDKEMFPINSPFSVIGDARAFTRADVGALMIGIREPECLSYNPKHYPKIIDDMVIDEHKSWQVLSQCADNLLPYFPALLDTGIAHYVSGPSCYVPDSNFLVGEMPNMSGVYAVAGCCGAGVAAGAGIGRLVAEMILDIEPYIDSTPFRIDRFGEVDPFGYEFQRRCAEARANKKGG